MDKFCLSKLNLCRLRNILWLKLQWLLLWLITLNQPQLNLIYV